MTKLNPQYNDDDSFPLSLAPEPPTWGINQAELSNLWHLSRTALARSGSSVSKYQRKLWASQAYHDKHPEVTPLAAYKVLDRSPWTHERGR